MLGQLKLGSRRGYFRKRGRDCRPRWISNRLAEYTGRAERARTLLIGTEYQDALDISQTLLNITSCGRGDHAGAFI